MDRKVISKTKYLAIFATTTLIFIIGLLIGSYITNIKLEKLERLEQDLRVDTLALEIEYLLVSENPCNAANTSSLTDELYNVGIKLDFMENSLGEKDERVRALKEYYSLLEIRHWLFIKKTNKECQNSLIPILYFYSNKGDCPKCQEQGFVLNYIRKKHPNARVYSFDININNSAVNTIKTLYNIDQAPSIIVNDSKYIGFMDSNVIEQTIESI